MIRKIFATLILTAIMFFAQSVSADSHITYQVSVQDYGWMSPVGDGRVAGTTDQGKRLEAIVINFSDGIEYNAHVQDIGWQGWTYSGGVAGTVGESRRMEAIRIRLRVAPLKIMTCFIGRMFRITVGKVGLKTANLPAPSGAS